MTVILPEANLYEHVHKNMPKVIKELQYKILEEAKKQIFESGLHSLKIRKIAENLNIAPGTIYNYYPSKEMIIGNLVAIEWSKTIEVIKKEICCCTSIENGIFSIAQEYTNFANKTLPILKQYNFNTNSTFKFEDKHILLANAIAQLIDEVMAKFNKVSNEKVSWIISELIIDIVNENKEYKQYSEIIEKIIK